MTLDKLAAGHGDLAPAFHWVFIAAAICLGISLLCLLGGRGAPVARTACAPPKRPAE